MNKMKKMNKKAQMELNPGAVIMGIIGFFLAMIMTGKMEAGIVVRFVTVVITTITCYFIASGILNS